MSSTTARLLALGLVVAAVAVVAFVWLSREPAPLPPDRAQIAPGDTFDDAHDVGLGATGWHEVDEAHRAFIGVPLGFEDQRVAPVAAARRPAAAGGRDLPASRFAVVEQRGETGRGVEPRQ